MGSLDAVFLAVEDSVSHLHIGSVGIFDGPRPSYPELRALVASKLPRVPRYRQRVREAPLSIGRPLWIDDADFDLDAHLHETSLRDDAPDGAFESVVGRVMSQPLDRTRALWEMWLVDGLPAGQWALISKVHHCMVDGMAGSDLLGVLMDSDATAGIGPADDWKPEPEPSRLALGRATARTLVSSTLRTAGAVAGAVGHPAHAFTQCRNVAVGLVRLVAPTRHAGTSLTGEIGPDRRWVRTQVSLDDVKRVRRAFGGTVNDVVLAAVTGGFRALLLERGEPVDGRVVSTLIPVSMRSADAHGVFDNRVSAVYAQLPVAVADPVERLRAVHAHMDELKESHEIDASSAVVGAGDVVPPIVAAVLARTIVHAQEIVQTVATNVPGPQAPLYTCGRQMLEAYPYVPIAGHVRIGVAIWSYCGHIYFGITGDLVAAPDIAVLARGLDDAFTAMLTAAHDRAPEPAIAAAR